MNGKGLPIVKTRNGLVYGSVIMKIGFFVVSCPPESLHENVVIDPTPAVHADSTVSEAIEPFTTERGGSTGSNRTVPRVRVHPHKIALETSHRYPRAGPPPG